MKDSSDFILQKQVDIIAAKPIEKRIEMSLDMINLVYDMTKQRILKQNPCLSQGETIVKIFCDFYERDFSQEEVLRICESILKYHQIKQNNLQ